MIKTLLLGIGGIGFGLALASLLIFAYIGIRELIFELRMKKVMRFLDTPEGKQKLEDLLAAVSRETGLPKWVLFCGADEFGNIKSDHWNIHLTAFAENQPTPSGKKVGLFSVEEAEKALEARNGNQ